jgi:hypothetical protein
MISSICSKLRQEGMTSEIRTFSLTQPLITPAILQGLAEAAFFQGKPKNTTTDISNTPIPVEVPAGSCIARTIETFDRARDSDVMVLQMSAPLANPFAGGNLGIVARVSLGEEATVWYWVPMAERAGMWFAGKPTPLAIRE